MNIYIFFSSNIFSVKITFSLEIEKIYFFFILFHYFLRLNKIIYLNIYFLINFVRKGRYWQNLFFFFVSLVVKRI